MRSNCFELISLFLRFIKVLRGDFLGFQFYFFLVSFTTSVFNILDIILNAFSAEQAGGLSGKIEPLLSETILMVYCDGS